MTDAGAFQPKLVFAQAPGRRRFRPLSFDQLERKYQELLRDRSA
jgi:hypothetical protein